MKEKNVHGSMERDILEKTYELETRTETPILPKSSFS